MGTPSANITDPELTLEFILDERGRELLWEAHRRTGPGPIRLVHRRRLPVGLERRCAGSASQRRAFRDLYPLPGSELATNPNLTQNPGY